MYGSDASVCCFPVRFSGVGDIFQNSSWELGSRVGRVQGALRVRMGKSGSKRQHGSDGRVRHFSWAVAISRAVERWGFAGIERGAGLLAVDVSVWRCFGQTSRWRTVPTNPVYFLQRILRSADGSPALREHRGVSQNMNYFVLRPSSSFCGTTRRLPTTSASWDLGLAAAWENSASPKTSQVRERMMKALDMAFGWTPSSWTMVCRDRLASCVSA